MDRPAASWPAESWPAAAGELKNADGTHRRRMAQQPAMLNAICATGSDIAMSGLRISMNEPRVTMDRLTSGHYKRATDLAKDMQADAEAGHYQLVAPLYYVVLFDAEQQAKAGATPAVS